MIPNTSVETHPPVDIRALNYFLKGIGSYHPELTYGPKSGEPLYHYTDLNGLLGIVKTHDLWLTHLRYSNDEEELTLGYKTAKAVIAQERSMLNAEEHADKLAYLDALSKWLETPTSAGVYICCFCMADDQLSQWRSYGANGTGVSVQIDWEVFRYVAGTDSPQGGLMRLWPVFYDPQTHERILKTAITIAFEQPSDPASTPAERARQAADFIEFFIPTFKNQGFEEEREYRLIFTPSEDYLEKLQFRVGRGMLIPYYSLKELSSDLPAGKLPIKGLRVGPSTAKLLNAESVQMLLKRFGYEDVKVDMSNTPYRG